jgi:hypothetical protein
MASTHKSLRSGTANKRPTTSIADGQIALNTNTTSPGLFFKDSTGATIIKVGPVHVGTTAPNASPAAGGSAGNSVGEIWLDTSLTPVGVKIWNGSAFVNATPIGSTTVQGLLELATNAETQTGTDPDRAVTPAGLQSKVSDSTSTTSSTTIASSTAVKSAYDLANAALPKSGGTVTGNLEIGTTGSLSFEGATADAFETTIAVTDPTADRTITLPDTTGTVVTTGDTGTVTSTMIADGTIVDADVNASAAIAHTKLANITAGSVLMGNASNVPTATAFSGDVTVSSSGVTAIGSGVIVNADVNASAAIAGTKISPDFGSQNTTTTGTSTAASFIPTSSTAPTNGVYLPSANNVAISTNGTGRLFVDASGNVGIGATPDGQLSLLGANSNTPRFRIQHPSTDKDAGISAYFDGSGTYLFLGSNHYVNSSGSNTKFDATSGSSAWYLDGSGNGIFYNSSGSGSIAERLRIDSSGRLGLGTSSPVLPFHVEASTDGPQTLAYLVNASTGGTNETAALAFGLKGTAGTGACRIVAGKDSDFSSAANVDSFLAFNTTLNDTEGERVRITSAGNVGIGSTLAGNANNRLLVRSDSASAISNVLLLSNGPADNNAGQGVRINLSGVSEANSNIRYAYIESATSTAGNDHYIAFGTNAASATPLEAVRIDSSRRLLVGTSSSTGSARAVFQGNSFSSGQPGIILIQRDTSSSGLTAGAAMGYIIFGDNVGSNYAVIGCEADGATGTNDYPSRLVFSTTADGASSPTEAMRITQSGSVLIQTTQLTSTIDGCYFNSTTNSEFHQLLCHSSSSSGLANLYINRQASDGALIEFRQADTAEGSISVSGTTVTYGGGHLARWSQLPNDEDPSGILKGTVMSNLDEMCEWGDEDNEQLNKTKVSDIEGDPNVAGLFVSTSFSEDGPLDFWLAMTGDMIIRIAEGVTVQRGDLLMSAGDGTAKPQDDDIIRSKTVAKVTSTHVTCTYADGSYCVPCVLMAC